jgi:1,4-dihydroxy-6-naphthoate synthase
MTSPSSVITPTYCTAEHVPFEPAALGCNWGRSDFQGTIGRNAAGTWRSRFPARTRRQLSLGLAFPEARRKTEMVFSAIEPALLDEAVDAGVIIHENRFTYAEKGLKKILDLGEFWERTTNAPIPLGGIVVRRSLPAAVQERVNRVMRRSVEFAFSNREASLPFVREHAQEMSEEVMYKHIDLYVNDYSVDLGTEGRQAIELLFAEGAAAGVIPPVKSRLFLPVGI